MNTPSTDSLNAVKKRVNSKNRAKYAGLESAAPVVREETTSIYNSIADKMNGIVASIGEINAQLNLTAGINAAWASKAIDRYITATSSAKKQIADLNSYLEQNAGALSNLSEAQLNSITALQEELTNTFTDIVKSVNKLSPKKQQAIKKVFSVFVDDLVKLTQVLQGTLGYKASAASATAQGLPVHPFRQASQADPEQQVSEPEKTRKPRKDKGVPRKKGAAGDEPARPAAKKPARKLNKTIVLETDGSEADTEEGLGYSGGAMMGDRMIGGIANPYSFNHSNAIIRRITPISFPAAMRKEKEGGVYLPSADYMPTRFL
jgi:hypothetical protein